MCCVVYCGDFPETMIITLVSISTGNTFNCVIVSPATHPQYKDYCLMPRSVLFYGTYVCRKQVALIVKDYIFIDAGRRSLVSYDYCHCRGSVTLLSVM